MRKFYWIYGAICVLLIVLKIVGLVNWWVVTAPIWFPLATFLCQSLGMVIVTDVGQAMQKKKEKNFKPSCDNCIFGKARQFNDSGKCVGEEKEAEIVDGICEHYIKSE